MVCVNTGKILEIGGGGGVGVVVAVWWCDFSEILEISLDNFFFRDISGKLGFNRMRFSEMVFFQNVVFLGRE